MKEPDLGTFLPDTSLGESEKSKVYFIDETGHTNSFDACLEEIVSGFESGRLKGDCLVRKTINEQYQWTTVAKLYESFRSRRI
jgi:hypothetical protein